MEWQTVNRKGGGKGWNHGVQDQLMQSMTAMQNSISQLAQSICTRPPPGEQGTGQGQTLQGSGKGCESLPGERKAPNLKPTEERAEPTTEEVKCPKCPNTYNWTTRVYAVRAAASFPRGMPPSPPPPPKSTGPASVKTGGGTSSSGSSSGTSYASVVKGETGQAETAKEEKNMQQKKADSIEKLLATMDKEDPLREDLENQLEQLRAALKDPRNPGARLDSAMAKVRKAKAKVERCQEQLRQAEESLKAAHVEEDEANSELKAAQANAVPKSELPPGDAAMQLSSDDISDLTDMLKQCGLLAVAACEDASEAQAKKARVGPYDNPKKTPREIAKLANPALVARLANSVHILQDAVKSGGDGSLEETQPGDPEALRGLSNPPPPPSSTSKSCDPARREGPQRNSEGQQTRPARKAHRCETRASPGKPSVITQNTDAVSETITSIWNPSRDMALSEFVPLLFPGKTDRGRCSSHLMASCRRYTHTESQCCIAPGEYHS